MRKSHIGWLAALAAVTLALAACSHVAEDWKSAQTADTAEAYQDFLRQHPDSEFGVTAQERIKQLAEDRDWKQASTADTLDAYQQFVAAHADGKWAQEARVRIENFQLNGASQAPAAGSAAAAPDAAAPVGAGSSAEVPPAPEAPAAATAAAPSKSARTPAAAGPRPSSHAGQGATGHGSKAASSKGSSAAHSGHTASATHRVQLGAYRSRNSAASAWHALQKRFPSALHGVEPHYVTTHSHGKTLVRLQAGVSSTQRGRELCSTLKKQSQSCVALR